MFIAIILSAHTSDITKEREREELNALLVDLYQHTAKNSRTLLE